MIKLTVVVPDELSGEPFTKGLASILDRCFVSVADSAPVVEEVKENKPEPAPEVVNVQEVKRVPKKLIKYNCPHCGAFNFTIVERDGTVYRMACKQCAYDVSFLERDLRRAEYDCSCGNHNYYYTPDLEDMAVVRDKCKCGSFITLAYDHETGRFVV